MDVSIKEIIDYKNLEYFMTLKNYSDGKLIC